MIDNKFVEIRSLTPKELASVIIQWREERGWTQETLAGVARVSTRTVQRVEKGLSSELDTKRALAIAFGCDDIDILEKPWPIPNIEKIKEEEKKLNETTFLIPLEAGLTGKKLRILVEGTAASRVHEHTELPEEASEIFAGLYDYIKDYLDIYSDLSAIDKVGIDKDFQIAIDKLRGMDIEIGVGISRIKYFRENWEDKTPITMIIINIIVGNSKEFPSLIRLPKQNQF